MIHSGYISLHRKIQQHPFWDDKPFSRGQAWIDLLMRVNHTKAKVIIGNTTIDLNAGETIWSMKKMAYDWGWSINKVGRFLNVLESESMVIQKRKTKYTKITVVNWSSYQQNENQTRIKRKSNENQTETNNNKEIIKNNTTNVVFGKPTINEMFEYWHSITGLAITSNVQRNRYACSNLYKKYGDSGLKRLIDGVAQARSDQYAPRIANFIQLQAKLDDLLVWGKKSKKGTIKI